MQIIFTSGVPGFCLPVLCSSFTFSGNTAGRGEYSALILATFVGIGTTCVEMKLSLSTNGLTCSCKKRKYLDLFGSCNEKKFGMKYEIKMRFSTNISVLGWQGRSCLGSSFLGSCFLGSWRIPWPLPGYPLMTFLGEHFLH